MTGIPGMTPGSPPAAHCLHALICRLGFSSGCSLCVTSEALRRADCKCLYYSGFLLNFSNFAPLSGFELTTLWSSIEVLTTPDVA